MYVLISFDTEDFVTPESHDAVKFYAQTLARAGIRGTFFLVAEKVRALKRLNRTDVVDALAEHEIGYHSNTHSLRPTINEYQNELPWHEAVEELVRREAEGLKEVAETFQRPVTSVCPPGTNWSAPMLAGFRTLGLTTCGGAMVDAGEGRPAWFAGVLNLCYIEEGDFFSSGELAEKAFDAFKAIYHRRVGARACIAVYTHPTMQVTQEFWDVLNLEHDRLSSGEGFEPAPLKPAAETAVIQTKFREFVEQIRRLDGIEFITYSQLQGAYAADPGPLDTDGVQRLARQTVECFDYQRIGERTISPAEAFVVLGRAALARLENRPIPVVAVPEIIGPANDIDVSDYPAQVTVSQLAQALKDLFADGDPKEVPSAVEIDGTRVGPHVLLAACAAAAGPANFHEQRSNGVINVPRFSPLPAVAYSERFQNLRYAGTWPIFPKDFTGGNLIKYNRLQSWSYKPCV